jgi:Superoxide dismutase
MKRTILLIGIVVAFAAANAQEPQKEAFNSSDLTTVYPFPSLPYAYDALATFVDKETMEIHYTKHYKAYYTKFLAALSGSGFEGKPLPELFASASKLAPALKNNAGGYFNHKLFWEVMSPMGGGEPTGKLLASINEAFGSFDSFAKQFEAAANGVFGSGWAWLAVDKAGKLFITSTSNQDNTLMDIAPRFGVPILALDVWEHAYYLRYQNRRSDYVSLFWKVVNWPAVEQKMTDAVSSEVI